ncbi:MAG: DUF2442 domain-containing protein [Lentisphaeria bacterium]|nr:DUF2442 domain-containing protein [Lentisphaeria bacterium]
MTTLPKIASVQAAEKMRLLVTFRNGEGRIYDCRQLLSRSRFHLLADPGFFRAVKVDAGGYGVSWNDDLDLSEYELWTHGDPVADHAKCKDVPASPR